MFADAGVSSAVVERPLPRETGRTSRELVNEPGELSALDYFFFTAVLFSPDEPDWSEGVDQFCVTASQTVAQVYMNAHV